jgi:hypothetical protein
MRTLDGKLLADLNDEVQANVTASIQAPEPVDINENATEYSLFPADLNDLPVITNNIFDNSTPKIIREEIHLPNQKLICLFDNNIIKVAVNSSFKLSVKANQPKIFNVENGIPKMIDPTVALTYTWFKDNDVIGGFVQLSEGTLTVNNDTLTFTGVGADAEGTYFCQVANDIGIVTTEALAVEVHNPASTFDAFFAKNLVENPFAEAGTDGWTDVVGSIATKSLLKSKAKELTVNTQLKTTNTNIAEYIPEQFYPYPKNVNILNLENYNLTKIHTNEARYFTRDNFDYLSQGGTDIVIAYQDIDLTPVQDYIKGKIFGVDGVKAIFSCYIGNAVSGYLPTKENVVPESRYKATNYNLQKPRLDVENILRAGPPNINETIKVFVQEYDSNTPLRSRLIDPTTYEIKNVNNLLFEDPLQKVRRFVRNELPQESVYPVDTLFGGFGQTLSPNNPLNDIIRGYNQLYSSVDQYYSFGQHVEFNTAFFDRLNYKTNKIRILLQFEVDALTLSDTWQTTKGVDKPLEYPGWQKPYQFLGFNLLDEQGTTVYNLSEVGKQPKYVDSPISKRAFAYNNPRGLVTAVNFALYPITPKFYSVIGYSNKQFVDNVIKVPTKEQDLALRYIAPSPYLASPPPPSPPVQVVYYKWRITQSRNAMPRSTFVSSGPNQNEYVYRTKFELFRKTPNGDYEAVPRPNIAGVVDNIYRFTSQRFTVNYADAQDLTTPIPPELNYIQDQLFLDDTYPSSSLDSLKLTYSNGIDLIDFVNNREAILRENGIAGVPYIAGTPGNQLFPNPIGSNQNANNPQQRAWSFEYSLRDIIFKKESGNTQFGGSVDADIDSTSTQDWFYGESTSSFVVAPDANNTLFNGIPTAIPQPTGPNLPEDWKIVDQLYTRKRDGVPQLPRWIWTYQEATRPFIGTLNIYDYEIIYDYKETNRR